MRTVAKKNNENSVQKFKASSCVFVIVDLGWRIRTTLNAAAAKSSDRIRKVIRDIRTESQNALRAQKVPLLV